MIPRTSVPLLVLLAGVGCALTQATPQTHYYLLAPGGAPPGRLPAPVRVHAFTIDTAFAGERIAYQTQPTRLDRYTFHRWATDPRAVVATAVRDYLEPVAGTVGPPLEIDGHIRRLLEREDASGAAGILDLDLTVRQGERTLLAHTYDEREPAARPGPEAAVEALSRALGRILDNVVRQLGAPEGR